MMSENNSGLVAGRFAVLDEIGRGGMGVVLRCEDRVLKRIIALKVLDCQDRPDLIARFHTEARAAARLDHPGIVKVLDFSNDDNRLFLCMDVIPGKSLDDFLSSGVSLAAEKAITLLLQIARALEHSHKNGVLHRDIKPSNIIVQQAENGDLQATIVDFGIAKLQTDDLRNTSSNRITLTRAGAVLGTPAYMSPEAARAEKLDSRSDIYSFGCLMYELLTGKRPFEADNSLELMLQHLRSPVPGFPDSVETEAGLEAITRRCLEKSPGLRFQSFSEVREALESLGESDLDPTEVRTDATGSGALWTLLVAALLTLVTAIAVTTIIGFDRPEPDQKSSPRVSVDPRHRLLTRLSTEEPSLSLAGQTGDFYLTGNVRGQHDLDILKGHPDMRVLRIEAADLRNVDRKPLLDLRLEELCLSASELDQQVLKDIGGIKTLRRLDLQYCSNISPDGIAGLANLENLETLNLHRTAVDDAGLARIAGLPNLVKLGLKECPYLTRTSWKTLAGFPRLAWLVTFKSGLEKGEQKNLTLPRELKRLETSRLSADLVQALRRSQVEDLMILEDRQSTRSDFLALGELEGLRRIGIFNCPACKGTDGDLLSKLRKSLPGCAIVVREGDRLDLEF